MTNAESKQQYEGAILQQLIKNSERLVVVESQANKIDNGVGTLKNEFGTLKTEVGLLKEKVDYIYESLKWIIGLLGAILVAVLANLLSQPILNYLN